MDLESHPIPLFYGSIQVTITQNKSIIKKIEYTLNENNLKRNQSGTYLDNKGLAKQYRLLSSAFEKLNNKSGKIKCQPKRIITLQPEGCEFECDYTLTQNNVKLQRIEDLVNLNDQKQKLKIFKDLFEQLDSLHSMDLLVCHFDLNYLGLDQDNNKYCLILFPNLTTVDELLQRGPNSVLCTENAVKSQFIWDGMSKATDYLALLKNFIIKFIQPVPFNQKYQEQEQIDMKTILKEVIYLDQSSSTFYLQCRSSNCDCQSLTFEKQNPCWHTTRQYSFVPPKDIFDKYQAKCAKQLKREEVIQKQFQEKNLEDAITNTFYEIFNTEGITFDTIKMLREKVKKMFAYLSQFQNEQNRLLQDQKTKQGLDDINEYIQLLFGDNRV